MHVAQLELLLRPDVSPEKLTGLKAALGPEGIGTFVVPQVLSKPQLDFLNEEINNADRLPWKDNHEDFENARFTVVQRHDVYALKLSRGNQEPVRQLPRLRAVATQLGRFIRGRSEAFPALENWVEDEMSLHRYDEPEVGLSFHKDNLAFFGLVAVLTTDGEKDLVILTDSGEKVPHRTKPGDLMLTRVNGLYEHPRYDDVGKRVNLCPDHGVYKVSPPYSTSFILRANSEPQYQIRGFEYANWVGLPKPKVTK